MRQEERGKKRKDGISQQKMRREIPIWRGPSWNGRERVNYQRGGYAIRTEKENALTLG